MAAKAREEILTTAKQYQTYLSPAESPDSRVMLPVPL